MIVPRALPDDFRTHEPSSAIDDDPVMIGVAHCSFCGTRADAEIRACVLTACPMRPPAALQVAA